tara:strand:+ start:411 stop:614 length:204 start_codon:yes stop_codon:yes gene_type:complete
MSKNKELSWDKNHQYGIFARIKGRAGWGEEQVKTYMDNNNIKYKKNDKMEQLVERLKWNEDKKYMDK